MSVRRNPPSFILVDKATGEVVYTKRATGVGSEAIASCVQRGRALAAKTGKTYFVYLDIMGAKIGMKISVPTAYHLGITEEIGPQGSAMPSGRRCCSSPDVRPSGQGMRCFNCQRWESDNYLKNPNYRARFFAPDMKSRETRIRAHGIKEALKKAHAHAEKLPKEFTAPRSSVEVDVDDVRKNIFTFNNPYGSIEGADKDAARELELYIENDADLYRQQYLPIIKNLMLKRRKGIFNPQLAAKLFLYLVETGAKKYCQQFGGVWHQMFSMPTRQLVANHFVFGFSAEADLGNYDHLLVKPTQRGLKAAVARRGASSEFEMDMGMYEKGYRYKLIPRSRAFDPLYAKTTMDVARVMREYKNDTFDTVDLRPPTSAHENPGRYVVYDFKRGCVVSRVMTTRQATNLRDSLNQKGERVRGDLRYGLMTPKNARGEDIDLGGDYVRKNIFTFNNPRKLNAMEQAAASVGLYVTTWAPGDGKTRYRFHRGPADYHDGSGIYTAVGRADAMKFIQSYGIGRGRKNPLTRAEAGQELKFAREAMMRGADLQRAGKSPTPEFNYAQGIAGVVGRRGTRAAARAAERVMRHGMYNNPPCPNPVIRGDKLPLDLKKQVLDSFPYRWTKENEVRARYFYKYGKVDPPRIKLISDEQWLREHAFHVTKGGKLDARHAHAEPHYMADDWKKGDPLPNPLLQTVLLANPPISAQWDRMTRRQREALLEIVGYDRDYSGGMTLSTWSALSPSAKRKLEAQWLDTTSSGGTTKRRRAPVAVNPLTRSESAHILKKAKRDVRTAEVFRPGHTRSEKSGQAYARAAVVKTYGPSSARRVATKIQGRAERAVGTVISNPGIRFPKPGTKMTVAQAMDLARKIGDRELIKQCEAAAKLQSKSNRGSKCVIWKTLPIGSPTRIDMVTAFAHYGDSPEDMYKPPKGSKKGPHMYRHRWGEGSGKQKPVPVLAAPSGKAIIKVMGPGQKVGDWMRG